VKLNQTYGKEEIHHKWVSVYRRDSAQDRFDEELMDRLLCWVNPSENALVLDAGCGTGSHSLRIAKRGYRCIGADISEIVLREARERGTQLEAGSQISFVSQALEELGFADETFDVVHCRGVLTHIPEWERALAQLCGVLKPGGWIILIEAISTSLEMGIVRIVRSISTRRTKKVETPGGTEFWSEVSGSPFVYRYANMKFLIDQLHSANVRIERRFCAEFWDINRFPSGIIRQGAIRFNRLALGLHFLARISSTNGIIGRKAL
jgi:ubiquinone/menaquinone biosynthesis C-methylase UbiE